jgi:hypothetical protein
MASEALNWALSNGMTQAEFDKNIFDAVVAAQRNNTSPALLRVEMDRLGISPADVARATGVTTQSVESQYNAAAPKTEAELIAATAAANELAARTARDTTASQSLINARNLAAQNVAGTLSATQQAAAKQSQADLVARQNEAALALQQRNRAAGLLAPTTQAAPTGMPQGFAQNFANYQAIKPGAQFDPSVTGGASPYGLIMGQMKPFSNPYANMPVNTPLGGYDPALYERIAAANLQRDIAAKSGVTLADYYGGGDGNSTAAGEGPGGNSGGGEGNGATAGEAGAGYAMGGMVNGLFGMNPPGPDDGAGYLDRGEYVVKKSSVDKYGRGLLDMINEGKVPAKKMKSLLG